MADNKKETMVRRLIKEELKKADEDKEEVSELREFSDKNPAPTTDGPYMVVYVNKGGAAFRKTLLGTMGTFKPLFIPGDIITLENLGDNLKVIEGDDRLVVVEKKMKKAPNLGKIQAYKKVMTTPDKEKESIFSKLTKKKAPPKKQAPKKASKAKVKGISKK